MKLTLTSSTAHRARETVEMLSRDTPNFRKFLHTMYKYVLNSVVKIALMFAQYFDYYAITLKGVVFVDTLYIVNSAIIVTKRTTIWITRVF